MQNAHSLPDLTDPYEGGLNVHEWIAEQSGLPSSPVAIHPSAFLENEVPPLQTHYTGHFVQQSVQGTHIPDDTILLDNTHAVSDLAEMLTDDDDCLLSALCAFE